MNLPEFALRRPAVVFTGFGLMVLWGAWAFETAPRSEDPEFTIRAAVVETDWPGASTDKIELLITDPIEDAINAIDEIETIRSTSSPGRSSIFIEALEHLDDVDNVWDKVRASLGSVGADLPAGASEPFLNATFEDTAIVVLAMYQSPRPGETEIERPYSPRQMELLADSIRDELERIGGVAKVELTGIQKESIYLEVDSGRWSQIELTLDRLKGLLESRNIVAPGGTIDTEGVRFGVEPSGEFKSVDEIAKTVVGRRADGLPVNLEQMGISVVRGYPEPPRSFARFWARDVGESVPCIVLSVTMIDGENVVDLGDEIQATLERVRHSLLPGDIELSTISNEPESVSRGIHTFAVNLIRAIVVVVLIAYLLIGMRIAIVMATAIPVVLCSAFGVAHIFGVQVDTISIAALIVVLGMLVDNAIEVSDNIHRYLEEGLARREAALKGAQEIGSSILVATLTTVAAFGPMLALPGSTGEYLYGLPIVVCSALLISYVVAMTLTTLLCYGILRGEVSPSPLRRILTTVARAAPLRFRLTSSGSSDAFFSFVRGYLRHKWINVGVAFTLFVLAFNLPLGSQFFPDDYRAQFVINIYLPPGSPLSKTDEISREVERIVRATSRGIDPDTGENVDRVEKILTYVGESGPRFRLGVNLPGASSNFAFMIVNTADPRFTDDLIREVGREAYEQVVGARVVPFKFTMGPPLSSPIALRILGEDQKKLRQIAEEVKDALRNVESTRDVHDAWGNETYQIFVEVDEEKAKFANVNQASIARTLNAFYSGHYLTTYREGDHQLPIFFRLPWSQRRSLDAVSTVYIEGGTGKVPLDSVAEVQKRWVPSRIQHYNGERNLSVLARVRQGTLANAALEEAMPEIRRIEASMPYGYRIEVAGELSETNKSQRELALCFVISLFLIVMCLVVKYNGFAKPLILMITLPLAFTGAIGGLVLTNQPLGFMAELGLLALAGIVLNDAIVLVDFVETQVKERRAGGEDVPQAGEKSFAGLTRESFRDCVAKGTGLRVRAITLTTLTTMGGLLPLALSGGPLWQPLATVIISGLFFASGLTLIILPSMFAILVENFGVRIAP